MVRRVAADARGRAVDGVLRARWRADRCVLYDDRVKFDPPTVWATAEREKVGLMTMVGDAYAAPLIEELDRTSYELSSLYAIGTGGAATNPKHVQRPAGEAAAADHHQRLRVVGDRQHGLRAQPAWHRTARRSTCARAAPWCPTTCTPIPATRRHRGRLGGAHGPDSVGLLRRCRRHPQDLPGRRRAAGGGVGGPRRHWRPTAPCGCSAATRWWSTPAARRSSSRRSKRCCAPTRAWPTRWWSAVTASGGARRSWR